MSATTESITDLYNWDDLKPRKTGQFDWQRVPYDPDDDLWYQKFLDPDHAIECIKAVYDDTCITSGLRRSQVRVDGAHIFPRDTWPDLAGVPDNILPLNFATHHHFDWVASDLPRSPEGRLIWLNQEDRVLPEFRGKFRKQAWRLIEIIRYLHPEYQMRTTGLECL